MHLLVHAHHELRVTVVYRVRLEMAASPIEAAEDDAGGPTRRRRRVLHLAPGRERLSSGRLCQRQMRRLERLSPSPARSGAASEAQPRKRERRDVGTGQRLGFRQADEVRRDQRRAKRDRVLAVVVLSVLALDHCGDL